MKCINCDGLGLVNEKVCPACNGFGKLEEMKNSDVNIVVNVEFTQEEIEAESIQDVVVEMPGEELPPRVEGYEYPPEAAINSIKDEKTKE